MDNTIAFYLILGKVKVPFGMLPRFMWTEVTILDGASMEFRYLHLVCWSMFSLTVTVNAWLHMP
jgi:hypothetical protein